MDDIKRLHFAEVKNDPPHSGHTYGDLVASINDYGTQRADHLVSNYGKDVGDWSQTHYEVGSWANGPLVYIEILGRDGRERTDECPTIGKGLTNAILDAGFVPFGFRPEMGRTVNGREETGRYMWYLVPLDNLHDMYDVQYGLVEGDDEFVRNDEGKMILFDTEQNANAVASDGQTVRKVRN